MITQQAKDHAQACLDATKEAAIHNRMSPAEKAAYMTILAGYEPKELNVLRPVPLLMPVVARARKGCLCDNCARARSLEPLIGGYQPCSGYEPPTKWGFWTAFPLVWYGVGSIGLTVVAIVAIVAAFKYWE